MTMKPVRRVSDPNLIAIAHLVIHLTAGKMTNRQLAKATGLTYLTVCRYTAVFHQTGAAHICGFEIDARGAHSIRIFKLGKDDDFIPPCKSRAQRAREQRRREAKNIKPLRGVIAS